MKPVILASTSPRRQQMLAETGIPFTVVASDYEEDMTLPLPPEELALHLAAGKAASVAANHPDDIVIAADTFVVFENHVIGKPKDVTDAQRILRMLSAQTHTVVSAFVIRQGTKEVADVGVTSVTFKHLSDEFIHAYSREHSMGKAGAYSAQNEPSPVAYYKGEYSTIIGFPMEKLLSALKQFGVHGVRKQ